MNRGSRAEKTERQKGQKQKKQGQKEERQKKQEQKKQRQIKKPYPVTRCAVKQRMRRRRMAKNQQI